MTRQRFIIEGCNFGSVERPDNAWSYAWFCPVCAKVWATAIIEGKHTFPVVVRCWTHEWTAIDRPGSLLLEAFDPDFDKAIPEGLLLRENQLWIEHDNYFWQHYPSLRPTSDATASSAEPGAIPDSPEDAPYWRDREWEDILPSDVP